MADVSADADGKLRAHAEAKGHAIPRGGWVGSEFSNIEKRLHDALFETFRNLANSTITVKNIATVDAQDMFIHIPFMFDGVCYALSTFGIIYSYRRGL